MNTSLRATTVALTEPPDLLARAGDDGMLFKTPSGGIAAVGEAARLPLSRGLSDPSGRADAEAALAAIPADNAVGGPGTGPLAFGALPFDPAEPAHLIVPERLFGRDGDRWWMTVVEPVESGAAPAVPGPAHTAPAEPPDRFTLVPSMSHPEWRETVSAAVERIATGELEKVVLARRIDISADKPFVVSDVLERLNALYPSCMVYSVEGFLGASPELLVSRAGRIVRSHPLAGTVARSGDIQGDEALIAGLLSSPKARHEHRVVVEAIATALAPFCGELDVPETPSVMALRNVSHLATHISGFLTSDPVPSALELVAAIHPTPAVCGTPADAALRYLQKVEGFDRGRYAGPVGWFDANGDGCFALGIRCAELNGTNASIFAGNGIVAGSDPGDELAETQLKLQALLAALVRP